MAVLRSHPHHGHNHHNAGLASALAALLSRHMVLSSLLAFLAGISARPICRRLLFPPTRSPCQHFEFEPLPDVGIEVGKRLQEAGFYSPGKAWKLARVARLPYDPDLTGAYEMAAPKELPPPAPSPCGPVCGTEGWGECRAGECVCPALYGGKDCTVSVPLVVGDLLSVADAAVTRFSTLCLVLPVAITAAFASMPSLFPSLSLSLSLSPHPLPFPLSIHRQQGSFLTRLPLLQSPRSTAVTSC